MNSKGEPQQHVKDMQNAPGMEYMGRGEVTLVCDPCHTEQDLSLWLNQTLQDREQLWALLDDWLHGVKHLHQTQANELTALKISVLRCPPPVLPGNKQAGVTTNSVSKKVVTAAIFSDLAEYYLCDGLQKLRLGGVPGLQAKKKLQWKQRPMAASLSRKFKEDPCLWSSIGDHAHLDLLEQFLQDQYTGSISEDISMAKIVSGKAQLQKWKAQYLSANAT